MILAQVTQNCSNGVVCSAHIIQLIAEGLPLINLSMSVPARFAMSANTVKSIRNNFRLVCIRQTHFIYLTSAHSALTIRPDEAVECKFHN